MAEEQAFLPPILKDPEDNGPRLIFADWLEERGDPRGEFIRVQCALARMTEGDKRRQGLEDREQELLQIHRKDWETPLRACGAREITIRRGFPDDLAIYAADFIAHGGELLKLVPGRGVRIVGCTSANVAALVRCPHLAQLTSLNLGSNGIGDTGAAALAASPHLARLTRLNLGCNDIGDAGAQALAASPHLARLTSLDLWANYIGSAGAEALAASPHLAHLTSLNLGVNGIGNAGAEALAASRHLAQLTSLELGDNYIGDAGAAALAASPHLAHLTSLDLESNDIGNAVAGEIGRTMEARGQRQQDTSSEGSQHGANPGGRGR